MWFCPANASCYFGENVTHQCFFVPSKITWPTACISVVCILLQHNATYCTIGKNAPTKCNVTLLFIIIYLMRNLLRMQFLCNCTDSCGFEGDQVGQASFSQYPSCTTVVSESDIVLLASGSHRFSSCRLLLSFWFPWTFHLLYSQLGCLGTVPSS